MEWQVEFSLNLWFLLWVTIHWNRTIVSRFDIRTPLNIFLMYRRLKTHNRTQNRLWIDIIGGISLRTTDTGSTLLLIIALAFLLLSSGVGTVSAEENFVAVRGDNVTITVTLLQNGTFGNPVPNQRIEFYDQTNNLLLGIDNTDITIAAKFDIRFSNNKQV